MEKKKFDFSGAFAIVLAILILLIFIPINMIFSYRDKVFDMTPSGQYTLNPITQKLLDETSDKHIDVYFLSHLNDLQEVIDAVCEEAKLYVKERKYGVTQQEFNFEGNADDPFAGEGNGEAGESEPLKEAS